MKFEKDKNTGFRSIDYHREMLRILTPKQKLGIFLCDLIKLLKETKRRKLATFSIELKQKIKDLEK